MPHNYLKKITWALLSLSMYSLIHTKQYVITNNSNMTVFVDLFSDEQGSVFVGGETADGKKTITITNPTFPIRRLKFYTSGKNRMVAFAYPTACENQTFEIKDDANNLTISNYCN